MKDFVVTAEDTSVLGPKILEMCLMYLGKDKELDQEVDLERMAIILASLDNVRETLIGALKDCGVEINEERRRYSDFKN